MRKRVAIVGVGSTLMGDDGVGPVAIEELRRRGAGRRAELIDAGLAIGEVLCDLDPSQPLIVIDAVRGGGPAGSLYELTVDAPAAEGGPPAEGTDGPAFSLHELSVAPALQMEALAGRRFEDVTVLGLEPQRLAWGEGLSPPVAEAMGKLVRAVCDHLDRRCRTSQE